MTCIANWHLHLFAVTTTGTHYSWSLLAFCVLRNDLAVCFRISHHCANNGSARREALTGSTPAFTAILFRTRLALFAQHSGCAEPRDTEPLWFLWYLLLGRWCEFQVYSKQPEVSALTHTVEWAQKLLLCLTKSSTPVVDLLPVGWLAKTLCDITCNAFNF